MEFLIDGLEDFFEFSANSSNTGNFSGAISLWFLFLGYSRFFYCLSSLKSALKRKTSSSSRKSASSLRRETREKLLQKNCQCCWNLLKIQKSLPDHRLKIPLLLIMRSVESLIPFKKNLLIF
jgi:hypothetical protein